ncbi:beta-galactosidase GalB [Marinoscillum sp.]|uniref:beta-galactosidase GalB n=1 Tax=Marinoscillum sp. TaxID=2024838 RepID=UPI003BA99FD9
MNSYRSLSFLAFIVIISCNQPSDEHRERISLNEGWRFMKYASDSTPDPLIYDVRPEVTDTRDDKPADAKPTERVETQSEHEVLKPWILPTGNAFISDSNRHYTRPQGSPGQEFEFVQGNFDDSEWESVDLPHDWAIKGPFYKGWGTPVGGGMGRLPSPGVAWYRKSIFLEKSEATQSVFLDIDGAMSYAMVWINGELAGGWPYGYTSFRIDLTDYIKFGEENQLAIRLDNPPNSSRWYPGGGIYRNVWLIKTSQSHIAHWGTFVTTKNVSESSAEVQLQTTIENMSDATSDLEILSSIYSVQGESEVLAKTFPPEQLQIDAGSKSTITSKTSLANPSLWGPPPTQSPNRYIIKSELYRNGQLIDTYNTPFGIRSIEYDPEKGIIVNGEHIPIKGVNQHHDLGALGAAFNKRAAERQLEMLKELGCNAIRIAHNPPAPELLDLTDSMGFLVVDELYDCWERKKTPLDFHLIYPDWHEQDLRALIRRDRNHPSVIMYSTGNEVGEQYTDEAGAKVAAELRAIANDEDPTRPTTASFNYAKPDMPITAEVEVINLNYQGEGIRNAPAYAHLEGINTAPLYPAFHEAYPDKVIISSENAAALSSRGTYLFPVVEGISSPINDSNGGDPAKGYVSAYELYTANFGSSADKVFRSLDQHPYVAGGFVWSGWDYLGEPTPYYLSRSSYFGLIDLAGFKKDRYYLYQSRWRPDLPMAHILPHWNWPDRVGEITPVHVFTSGDEAELFVNGKSLSRKKKGEYEYRLRWDDVIYEPGELKVITYRDGEKWAEDLVSTSGTASQMVLYADRKIISSDGKDLSFITVELMDANGVKVPNATNEIIFDLEGPGSIVATDNGDPTDLTPFPSKTRNAFSGKALVIVQSKKGATGKVKVTANSPGLMSSSIVLEMN